MMHENDYLDTLTYGLRYVRDTSGTGTLGTLGSDETRPLLTYDRRPDYFFPYYKPRKPIGTVEEKAISIKSIKLDGSLNPAWYAILGGCYPEKIIHDGPATIVFWLDKTKTVVKCSENDIYDPFDAFTAALAKKIYGTTSSVKTMLKKVTVEQKPKKEKSKSADISSKSALDVLAEQAHFTAEAFKAAMFGKKE